MCVKTFFLGVRDKYLFGSFIQDAAMFIVLTLTVINIIMITTTDEYDISVYRLLLKLAEFTMYTSLLWLGIKLLWFIKLVIYKFRNSESILSTLDTDMYNDTFTKFIISKLHCGELTIFEKIVLLSRAFADKCMAPLLIVITMFCIYHSYTTFPIINDIRINTTNSGIVIKSEQKVHNTIFIRFR